MANLRVLTPVQTQARAFGKLQKLRKDQASLPIAAHREEIIETVRQNQVTVVGTWVSYLLPLGFCAA